MFCFAFAWELCRTGLSILGKGDIIMTTNVLLSMLGDFKDDLILVAITSYPIKAPSATKRPLPPFHGFKLSKKNAQAPGSTGH